MAADHQCHRFHTGLIAGQQICRLDLEAMALCPAAVHAQQHLGPVLSLGSARTGVQRQYGIIAIVRAGEQHLELQGFQTILRLIDSRLDVLLDRLIAFLDSHLIERLRILVLAYECLVLIDADLDIIQLLVYLLSLLRIIPECRLAHLVFELSDLLFLSRHLERLLHLVQLFLEIAQLWFQVFQHLSYHLFVK